MRLSAFLTTITLLLIPSFVHAADRPNIVVILADDMGYSDIGCYGGEIKTPNLDKMAAEGLRFTQFYNAARCCPTRASLLTGLYPHQAGMGGMVNGKGDTRPEGPYQGYLNDRCVTIAEVLKTAGYGTYMSGKWHVGEERPHWPVDRGFDRYYGLISGAMNYFDIDKGKADNVTRRFAIDGEAHRPPNEEFYLTDTITEHAVGYLREAQSKQEPFFLYVAYTAPHWPLHVPEEAVQPYVGKYRDGWEPVRAARYERMRALGIVDDSWPLTPPDAGVADWDGVEEKALMDRRMAVYAAQMELMDQGIGMLMRELEDMGVADDTLVLFLSDNGACHESGPLGFDRRNNGVPVGGVDSYMSYGQSWANVSNTPFRMYKHWVHEGGIATPLVARWPAGIQGRGTLVKSPGHVVDIMATCVELSGASYPTSRGGKPVHAIAGKSLFPIFQGVERKDYGPVFWEHMGSRAIRDGDWKLVSADGGPWELYNLSKDRTETLDLAGSYPEKRVALETAYEAWARSVGVRTR